MKLFGYSLLTIFMVILALIVLSVISGVIRVYIYKKMGVPEPPRYTLFG